MSDLHDFHAERLWLGACWQSHGRVLDDTTITAEDFTHLPHRRLHEAMVAMRDGGIPFDAAGMTRTLGPDLPNVSDALADVVTSGVVAQSAGWHANVLTRLTTHRRVVEAATRITQAANGDRDLDDLTELARAEIDRALNVDTAHDVQDWAAHIDRALTRWHTPVTDAAPTGWWELDELLSGGGLRPGHLTVIGARPGTGKALALDTPIPTPTGWTTMGEVAVGQQVIGMDGQPTTVVAATEVMSGRPCYEVEFSDGEVIVADAQHQWLTSTRAARRAATPPGGYVYNRSSKYSRDQRGQAEVASVKTTEQIAGSVRVGCDQRVNHSVPVAAPIALPERDLLIDPYILGYWLGDGTSVHADITVGHDDRDALIGQVAAAGYHHSVRRTNTAWRVRISTQPIVRGGAPGRDSLQGRLRTLGLLGNKHIPDVYLRASVEQRTALLAGLLDSDGTVGASSGRISLALTSPRLARQALELARSLGYLATISSKRVRGRTEASSTCFTVGFVAQDVPFRLARKAERVKPRSKRGATRYIVDVRPVSSVPVRCIQVDNEDHMYLAGRSMVPTHNSLVATMLAGKAAAARDGGVYFASVEMTADELTDRIAAAASGTNLSALTNRTLTPDEAQTLHDGLARIRDWPLALDDRVTTIADIRRGARNAARRHGKLRIVLVDYLQLLDAKTTNTRATRQELVSELSRSLKLLAREHNVPVVMLAQLNRAATQRADKQPVLTDLRESGSVEQDGDEVILLHRDDDDPDLAGQIQLNLAKNRHGPTGIVRLRWLPQLSRITNLTTYGSPA